MKGAKQFVGMNDKCITIWFIYKEQDCLIFRTKAYNNMSFCR
jgi:hypothetical protein